MKGAFPSTIAAVLMVVLAVATTKVAEAQNTCVSELVKCSDSLNSTRPEQACCDAIKSVVATQLDCLCRLYNNPALLGGINMTQALELPKRCNLSSDTSICNKAMSPDSSPGTPPATAGGGNDGNGAGGRISWMGVPALLLVSAITFLY